MSDQKTVTVDAQALQTGLSIARLFVSRDEVLPMICSIQLTVDAGRLTLHATDRYTMCRYSIPAEGDWGAPLLLRPAQFKALRSFLHQGWKGDPAHLRRAGVSVRAGVGSLTAMLPAAKGVDPFKEKWLNGKSAASIQEWYDAPAGPVSEIGLNPILAARFAKVVKMLGLRHENTTWTFVAEMKPVKVAIGRDFRGLIMPQRLRPLGSTS